MVDSFCRRIHIGFPIDDCIGLPSAATRRVSDASGNFAYQLESIRAGPMLAVTVGKTDPKDEQRRQQGADQRESEIY